VPLEVYGALLIWYEWGPVYGEVTGYPGGPVSVTLPPLSR